MSNPEQPERILGFNTRLCTRDISRPDDQSAGPHLPNHILVFDNPSTRRLCSLRSLATFTRAHESHHRRPEQRVASLENGVAGFMASGQSAQLIAISSLMQGGDHMVAASTLYGGRTRNSTSSASSATT
jgi:O-acetylhomoserine (thiol)-lyase